MKITKEQLAVEYEKAKDARDDWRTKYYNMEWENRRLQEELDDKEWSLKKLHNQVHFLAWMLYNKWVRIDEYCWRLDIIVEEKPNEEIKPIYWTITDWNTFTYCDANK